MNKNLKKTISILVGKEVNSLPKKLLTDYTAIISNELALRPHTMLQFSNNQLLVRMKKGQCILAINSCQKLLGFGQLWQYGSNNNGQEIFEFGSWLSFQKRIGSAILQRVSQLIASINPQAQVIAIIAKENTKVQHIIQKKGGKEIGKKFSPKILNVEKEPAEMLIFDITNI